MKGKCSQKNACFWYSIGITSFCENCVNFEPDVKEKKMDELKPCPFCGCKQLDQDIGVQYDEYGTSPVRYFYSVVCSDCGCRTTLFNQKANAAEAWNRRANNDN